MRRIEPDDQFSEKQLTYTAALIAALGGGIVAGVIYWGVWLLLGVATP